MSRIARAPITIPKGVTVNYQGQLVSVKGSKGELSFELPKDIALCVDAEEIKVDPAVLEKKALIPMAGTTRAIVNNMIQGVSVGFERKLELRGVGYRAEVQGAKLKLNVGYSHPVEYDLPEGVTAAMEGQTVVVLTSCDKQKVGQVAAEIRRVRPPESYKGKGIRYFGEHIEIKETKKK